MRSRDFPIQAGLDFSMAVRVKKERNVVMENSGVFNCAESSGKVPNDWPCQSKINHRATFKFIRRVTQCSVHYSIHPVSLQI